MSKWKKSLAMVLTAAMLLSVLPVSTWAAESEPEPEDEVVFNLGTMDVTVGTDQARAEEGQEPYDLFQADGSSMGTALDRSRIWASFSSKEAVAPAKPRRFSSFRLWLLYTPRP